MTKGKNKIYSQKDLFSYKEGTRLYRIIWEPRIKKIHPKLRKSTRINSIFYRKKYEYLGSTKIKDIKYFPDDNSISMIYTAEKCL